MATRRRQEAEVKQGHGGGGGEKEQEQKDEAEQHAAVNEADQGQEDTVDAPLVFQCGACRAIVGDTFSWVCSDEDLSTITLTGAAPVVTINSSLQTSTSGPDVGSTYDTFQCDCGEVLGRVYRTTARHFDHLRDLMTFHLDALTSYKLGSAGVSAEENDRVTFPSATRMKEDIGKIQLLMLTHDEKLLDLEDKVSQLEQTTQARSSKRSKRR